MVRVAGLAITSTSGSLVVTGANGEVLRPAILYDDGRSTRLARELSKRLPAGQAPLHASFSLSKALWVREHEPQVWRRAAHVLHPADWLTGKFTGNWGVGDYSNALKLGWDYEKSGWADAVRWAGIPAALLPRVVAPGHAVGAISERASVETHLPAGVPVLAGASDGMASMIASGASDPGDANSTLGTTLVWKVLSRVRPALAPGMYCHRLPNGLWAPGAASNSGPGSLRIDGPDGSPAALDARSAALIPSPVMCYILNGRGVRFPFAHPQAETFFEGGPASAAEKHAAQLQALACLERWGYERLEAVGVEIGNRIFSAGGAASSAVFSQLRANVTHRTVLRCAHPNAAFGAAILAAGTVLFGGDLGSAIRGMTRVIESLAPEPAKLPAFEQAYVHFRQACARRGYA